MLLIYQAGKKTLLRHLENVPVFLNYKNVHTSAVICFVSGDYDIFVQLKMWTVH